MCYAKPGPRCSGHARTALIQAINRDDANAIAKAQADFETTPIGITQLLQAGDIDRALQAKQRRQAMLTAYREDHSTPHMMAKIEQLVVQARTTSMAQVPIHDLIEHPLAGMRGESGNSALEELLLREDATSDTLNAVLDGMGRWDTKHLLQLAQK